MQIEGENGWRTELREGPKVLGRGLGFPTTDRTVSRRHVSFELHEDSKRGVRFEVIGKNPIWVLSSGSGEIRVFRRHQGGEMESGDSFCVSLENPIWFSLKRIEFPEMGRCGVDSLNVSDIDPVKEFGFIVMGHEFESYPKRMVRDIKTWNWFLEEPSRDSEEEEDDDDEVYGKKKQRSRRGKRKQAEEGNGYDDEWMGEGDEGKELVAKIRTNQRPKYSTRSKDKKKIQSSKNSTNRASREDDNEYETEDEDTLGGFIVSDGEEGNEEEEEEEEEGEEEEEEEEEEDYDEDDEEMDE